MVHNGRIFFRTVELIFWEAQMLTEFREDTRFFGVVSTRVPLFLTPMQCSLCADQLRRTCRRTPLRHPRQAAAEVAFSSVVLYDREDMWSSA